MFWACSMFGSTTTSPDPMWVTQFHSNRVTSYIFTFKILALSQLEQQENISNEILISE